MNIQKVSTITIELDNNDIARLEKFLKAHDQMIEIANHVKGQEFYLHNKTYDDLCLIVSAYHA